MDETPPLVLDIDGTLTRPDGWGIDPRVFDPLRSWDAPVIIATGKSFPYPVALCQFIEIPERVIAENGGVVCTDDRVEYISDKATAQAVVEAYQDAGYELGWRGSDTANRWRETELAVSREQPLEPLETIAANYGLEVVDTKYAYHIKDPDLGKGNGLERLAEFVDLDLEACVAVGDSVNDVSTFERVGRSFAVENADEAAKAAADEILEKPHAEGTLALLEALA